MHSASGRENYKKAKVWQGYPPFASTLAEGLQKVHCGLLSRWKSRPGRLAAVPSGIFSRGQNFVGLKKVLGMAMGTISMLGWSSAKVACQKSACDTMSLKCQGRWQLAANVRWGHSNTKEPPPATEDPFHSRASACSRRVPGDTATARCRLHAAPRKPHF